MSFTKPTNGVATNYAQQVGRLIDLAEGPHLRNYVRNGDFQVAQRGATFTGITTDQYTLDGWIAGAGGTNTVTQQAFTVGQTDVPGNPRFCLRVARTVAAAADNTVCSHRMEHPDFLSGKTVTVSFWAQVASGTKALVFDFNSSGVTPAVDTADNAFTATTTWTLFQATIAIPAMTAATAASYLALRIREAASFGTFTLNITDVQIEPGSEATYFERLPFAEQLAWNQRFFSKSFPLATAPAQNTGYSTAGEITWGAGKAGALAQYSPRVLFPVRMRAVPTITTYNPVTANSQVRDFDAAADCSGTATYAFTEGGFSANCTGAVGTAVGNLLRFGWSASAEL